MSEEVIFISLVVYCLGFTAYLVRYLGFLNYGGKEGFTLAVFWFILFAVSAIKWLCGILGIVRGEIGCILEE